MSISDWIVRGGGIACRMREGEVLEIGPETDMPTTSERVVRVGEGAPDKMPCAVLSATGEAIPALVQDTPPDAISGWVRLWIAGFLETHPNWDGVVCALHGDILHWIHVSADEAVSSQSSLTPRLWQALNGANELDDDALATTLSRPERLAAHLRSAEVSGNRAALTGHLLGADLAATRAYWLGQQLAVIGEGPLVPLIAQALQAQGVPTQTQTPDTVLPNGLARLARVLGLAE